MNGKNKTIKGTLLIAGTSIGGGMLALPVELSLGGFIPSVFIYLFCWGLMACTGLLFLEISMWMKGESNIISMAKKTLGRPGEFFAWFLYLFQFYLLTLAYISGCGTLIAQVLPNIVSESWGPLLFVLLFSPVVYCGAKLVGRINVFFVIGLAICYFSFVYLGLPYVNIEMLAERDWTLSLIGLPIAFTSFAYQGTIPTLVHYLDHNPRQARIAIIIGSSLPFFAYVIWQALILGIIPTYGPNGLAEAFANGDNAVYPLRFFTGNPYVYPIGQFFAFFAMVTSFFGVTLGLQDFLADGLRVKKTPKGRLFLAFLVFIPPLIASYFNPKLFLTALGYAGGFGCALLLGLLPILMAWSGRYIMKLQSPYSLKGGKILLFLLGIFFIFEVAVQISLLVINYQV